VEIEIVLKNNNNNNNNNDLQPSSENEPKNPLDLRKYGFWPIKPFYMTY